MMQLLFVALLLAVSGLNAFRLAANSNKHTHTSTTSIQMAGGQVPLVPYYPNPASKDYQWMDIYNALGRTRTLFVGRYLDNENCNQLISSLVWLSGQDDKKPITMYFNVPGAATKPALAVFDIMMRMKCPITTINMGLTCGMGALLCAAGTSGQRYAMPNARFLMAKGGMDEVVRGQATHVNLMVKEIIKDNDKMVEELARLSGQPTVKLHRDLARDFYLTAPEAAAYGIVDKVMMPAQPIKMMRYRGTDDDVVGYGHFSETRKVKNGPADKIKVLQPYTGQGDGSDYDDYAAREMERRGFEEGRPPQSKRIDPRSLRNGGGVNRFAGSRCKPPGAGKPLVPKTPSSGDDDTENPFINTGW